MKFKNKLSACILIFVFVLIIANCSFADDSNQTVAVNTTTESSDVISATVNSEIYISSTGSDDNDGSINSPKATFSGQNGALKTASSNNINTIIILDGTIQESNIYINSSIYSLNSLTIKGSASSVIDANNEGNIFNIQGNTYKNGFTITLENIDFINSYSVYATIANQKATLTINNCNFYDNYGETGGVIENYYSATTTITNSNFYNNKGESGIIYNNNGNNIAKYYNTVNVINCTFFNNSATDGAVFNNIATADAVCTLNINNSTFINNQATQMGGVILSQTFQSNSSSKATVIVNIDNSTFIGNTANSGGVIYASGSSTVTINNSSFVNNSATGQYDATTPSAGSGGGIYSYGASVIIDNSYFENNTASNGGAIFNDYANDIQITNSTFIANEAKNGGALYMYTNQVYGHESYVENSTFKNNKAECFGDAIYAYDLDDVTFELIQCNITNNTIYNKGNVKFSKNNLTDSDIINIGNITDNDNNYINSEITELEPIIISILNAQGCYGETITLKATVSDGNGIVIIPGGIILTIEGSYEIPAYYNESSKLYEASYLINKPILSSSATSATYEINADCLDYVVQSIKTATLTVYKLETFLTVTAEDIYEGQTAVIKISLKTSTENIAGYVTVKLNGSSHYVIIKDGEGSLTVDNLAIGKYNVEVSFKTTFKYIATSGSCSFNVYNTTLINVTDPVDNANLKIYNVSGYYGETITLQAILTNNDHVKLYDQNGIKFIINSQEYQSYYNSTTNTYECKYTIDSPENLTIGGYYYNCANSNITNGTLTFIKNNTAISISVNDCFAKEDLIANIELNVAIDGEVTITINNQNYTKTLVNGKGSFNISNSLNPGNYTAIVNFKGDDYYNPSTNSTSFDVKKINTILKTQNETLYYTGEFQITLVDQYNNPLANQILNVEINNSNQTLTTDMYGKVILKMNGVGTYQIKTYYNGDEFYTSQNAVNVVEIVSSIIANDLTKYYKNDTQFSVKFLNLDGTVLKNTNVIVNIIGKNYTLTTDSNGIATLQINVNPGEYTITSFNLVTGQSYSNTINVLSTIQGNDLRKYYKNDTQYSAKFLNLDGTVLKNTDITFNIIGKIYTIKTDSNGIATLPINLIPGEYTITATNSVNGQMYSNTITVLSTIEGNDITKYYKNGTQYTAKFLNPDGTPLQNREISFNIIGKFYQATTDSNGIATLPINLNPGTYIVTSTNPTNGQMYSNTIKVLSIIESKDLVMKYNDGSTFNVKVLNQNGKGQANAVVTFNINGIIYTKISDSEGMVKLPITLTAGKYIVTIEYNGAYQSNTITVNK